MAVQGAQQIAEGAADGEQGLRNDQDDEQAALRTLWNEENDEGLGQRAMSCAFASIRYINSLSDRL